MDQVADCVCCKFEHFCFLRCGKILEALVVAVTVPFPGPAATTEDGEHATLTFPDVAVDAVLPWALCPLPNPHPRHTRKQVRIVNRIVHHLPQHPPIHVLAPLRRVCRLQYPRTPLRLPQRRTLVLIHHTSPLIRCRREQRTQRIAVACQKRVAGLLQLLPKVGEDLGGDVVAYLLWDFEL